MYACDFFAVEALGVAGTVRYLVFFVMHVKSRVVEIGGIVVNPTGEWMMQVGRSLLDPEEGFLRGATHLIVDRDPVYTGCFGELLERSGVNVVRIPAQSPNCNPHAERFVGTVREECLELFVIFGERHLRHLVREFVAHYHAEPFHQGLGGQLVTRADEPNNDKGSPAERSAGGLGWEVSSTAIIGERRETVDETFWTGRDVLGWGSGRPATCQMA